LKSKFWTVGLACFLLFCVAPASALASSISGVVTGEGAAPLASVTVCAQRISGEEVVLCQNQTPASGEYEIENLEAGEYWVEFIPPGGGYLVEYWNNVPFGGTPTTIELAEGEDLTGIDAELGKGGEIKGQITALGGGPLGEAGVCATLVGGAGESSSCARVGEEGEYELSGLIPGNYILEFAGPSSGPAFRTSWWQGKSTEADAELVPIAAGQVFIANAALEPVEGVIEGTLTAEGASSYPDGSVCVFASGEEGTPLECVEVSYDGHFAFGLEEGSYVLRYEDPGYTTLYSGGATAFDAATAIPVTEGQVSAFPASIELHALPGISGTVTDASDNFPIESGEACALVMNEAPVCAPLEAGGAYSIPVGPGSYQVEFRAGGYGIQFWSGAAREFEATPVEVTDRLVTGIDAQLDAAEAISGHVTAAANGEGLFGIEVCATPVAGGSPSCRLGNGEGFYELTGLSGEYVVSFSGSGYVTQYWNGVESKAQATPITVDSEHHGHANASLVEAVSPTNTTAPTVSGTGKVGQTLSCGEGTWSGTPATFTYKYTWLRGTQTISGAKSNTYTLATADAGQTIKCSVTATNTAGTGSSVKSSNGIAVAALRKLTVTKVGNGSGTVTSTPTGINCGATCSLNFSQGEVVSLTATPAAHVEFIGWSGACTGVGACEVTLGATGAAVTATFTKVTHAVSVAVSGGGSVSAGSGVISGCTEAGGSCSGTYEEGTEVTLVATPAAHQQLSGWSGCTVTLGDECKVTVAAAENVTATFAPITHTLTVTKSGDGSGTVTSVPAGIACGALCASDFEEGATVTLTAVADSGSEFTGWSGACTGVGPCLVTLGSDQSVVAGFAKKAGEGGGAGGGETGDGSNTPPSSGTPTSTPSSSGTPAPTLPTAPITKPVKKKPLQCKRGFRKLKQKGKAKVRCVKVKPKHRGAKAKPKHP
jgi:Divergent InlB B-repeat domain